MASGGARARSGPAKDPNSARSERAGYTLSALPAEGYKGRAPKFPLPKIAVYEIWFEDGKRVKEFDETGTDVRNDRELALWKWAWKQPQAAAWKQEPWRQYTVAQWVRQSVNCEEAGATAADKTAMLRLQDQIGLSQAGLSQNGWKIGSPAPVQSGSSKTVERSALPSSRSKMKMVRGG